MKSKPMSINMLRITRIELPYNHFATMFLMRAKIKNNFFFLVLKTESSLVIRQRVFFSTIVTL